MSTLKRLFAAEKNKKRNGLSIAFLDTGISPEADFTLPENRIIAFRDLVNGKTEPYDDNGHGTHVTGASLRNQKRAFSSKTIIRKPLAYSCSLLRKPTKSKKINSHTKTIHS